jgi:hypothetical protein
MNAGTDGLGQRKIIIIPQVFRPVHQIPFVGYSA